LGTKCGFSETFLILRKIERYDKIKIYIDSHVKYDFNAASIFAAIFFFLEKNTQMSSFIKIRPWVAEMFYGDGQKGKT